jgi:hypothetical protein
MQRHISCVLLKILKDFYKQGYILLRKLEPMSRTGYNKLMEELKQLETVELPDVMKNVAEARELGDLKENGAYIYGRERQGHIVGRIGELKGRLNRAEIIDCTKVECDKANFGTVVTLLDLDTQKKISASRPRRRRFRYREHFNSLTYRQCDSRLQGRG